MTFDSIKTFIAEGGAKTGQEIMDHLNMASPVARSILRDMVVKRELVHKKGLYYLQGQEMVSNALDMAEKVGEMIKGRKADVVVIDEVSKKSEDETKKFLTQPTNDPSALGEE
jgi:hypothetical protein